jgi:hypothetical protein
MGNLRALVAFAALALLLAFMAGCVQGRPGSQTDEPDANFTLPDAEYPYFARYNVEEGGMIKKEVWRDGNKMRSDLSVQGQRALSFFFMNSRAYSCSYVSSEPSCYDVTPGLSQLDAERMVPSEKNMAGADKVESVKIGDTMGNCYEMASAFGLRKICFADGGAVAFDSYNASRTVMHIEYLTNIEYFEKGKWPFDGVFVLPSKPAVAPGVPEPRVPFFEN